MSLDLVYKGSLARPGPIGRLLRFALGVLCLYALWELIDIAPFVIERPIELLPNLALMGLIAICVFNYVINIGFSRGWNYYPILVSLAAFGIVAATGFILTGSAGTIYLGVFIVLWLGYFYAHLGISFVLAATLGTPGCEMRAIPELFGKVTHREVKEHHCPSTIITGIDRWESKWLGEKRG